MNFNLGQIVYLVEGNCLSKQNNQSQEKNVYFAYECDCRNMATKRCRMS